VLTFSLVMLCCCQFARKFSESWSSVYWMDRLLVSSVQAGLSPTIDSQQCIVIIIITFRLSSDALVSINEVTVRQDQLVLDG